MAVSSKWSGRGPFKAEMWGSSPPIATNPEAKGYLFGYVR